MELVGLSVQTATGRGSFAGGYAVLEHPKPNDYAFVDYCRAKFRHGTPVFRCKVAERMGVRADLLVGSSPGDGFLSDWRREVGRRVVYSAHTERSCTR